MRFLVLIILILLSGAGFSQLAFENKTNVTIKLAFGYFIETPKYEGWVTEGWYVLKPGDKVTVIDKPLDNEYFYYYASSSDTAIEFKGQLLLKVGEGKFKIEDANKNVSLKNDNHRFFRQIDTEDKKNFIVILHETFVEEK